MAVMTNTMLWEQEAINSKLHYFQTKSCFSLKNSARSHYMNGVGCYENDSVVEACQEYMKALDIMEDHFEEKELVGYMAKFMALTYTRLTDVYSDLIEIPLII